MFATGFYAVRVDSDMGFAFYKENRTARMRASWEKTTVVYFTVEEYEIHMELYYNTDIPYEGR